MEEIISMIIELLRDLVKLMLVIKNWESPNFGSTKVETISRPSVPTHNFLHSKVNKKPYFPSRNTVDRNLLNHEYIANSLNTYDHSFLANHSRNAPLYKRHTVTHCK